MENCIAIERIQNDDVQRAVFSALAQINAQTLMTKPQMTILLKPNLLSPKPPERAVDTHPKVVEAVIHWLQQFQPKRIIVGDSSANPNIGFTDRAIKQSGIGEVCEREKVECIPLEKSERKVYNVPNPLVLDKFASSSFIAEADLIINLPKIKTHNQCILTCCIKNMFGTVLLGNKPRTHALFPTIDKFAAALADIYSVSKPQLTIIDGYLCQEGPGPSAGDVVKLDLILAGYDPVALDTTVCKIIDVKPNQVHYLAKAQQKGLGTMDLTQVKYYGNTPEAVKRPFKLPQTLPASIPLPKKFAEYMGKTIFRTQIKFNSEKCKLCGTCWKNCPVQAISPPRELKPKNVPRWNEKKCIACYCCAETCPYEAVECKVDFARNILLSPISVIMGLIIVGIILLIILL